MQILNLPGLTTCTIEDTHSGGSVTGLTTPIFSLLPSFHLFRPFQRIGADLFEFSRFPKLAWLSSHRSHVKPVIHSARRVPATLRPRIKTELDRMETERTTPPSPNSQPAISENWSRSIRIFTSSEIGCVPGCHHIEVDKNVKPVIHSARRVHILHSLNQIQSFTVF